MAATLFLSRSQTQCFLRALTRHRTRSFSTTDSGSSVRVAVLHQALDPPTINGIRKPKKPGGYQDSGADIAYVLKQRPDTTVITPSSSPDPRRDSGWCFPDTEDGIVDAIQRGATHLWANTILFAQHPLQTSKALTKLESQLRVVGQPPKFVELFDDKNFVNQILRAQGGFTLPPAVVLNGPADLDRVKSEGVPPLQFPIVAKPVRGRGSYGVKLCSTKHELVSHCSGLMEESPSVILEQYLSGEEATVTVMPPSAERPEYWPLPVVTRFNHVEGIAPYNGVVAVTQNSRVVSQREFDSDPSYSSLSKQCAEAARLLQCQAPVRIDVRRFKNDEKSEFALFDFNMKPNMTGPGRPGRENQASLTALAAAGLGWDYPTLLSKILASAGTLAELRHAQLPQVARRM